jgi:hypothetical protein
MFAGLAQRERVIDAHPGEALRVALRRLDQVRLRVELHQVRHRRVVAAVAGDQPELRCVAADDAVARDAEQVLRVGVVGRDRLAAAEGAVEVVVEVLDLLVAGEEHQAAGALRHGLEILFVPRPLCGRHVGGNVYLREKLGHGDSSVSISGRATAPERGPAMNYRPAAAARATPGRHIVECGPLSP